MTRTAVTPITLPAPIATTPVQVTFTAVDVANANSSPSTGTEFILIKNGTGANTFTTTSVADQEGNTGDIAAAAVAAATYYITQVFQVYGWKQADGNLYFTGSSANVTVAVLRIPQFTR